MQEAHDYALRYLGLRKKLVGQLRQKNIRQESVLQAILDVPRHLFMPQGMQHYAYEDKAFPIGVEQTISQPYTVAFQTQLLDIQPTDRVLEIGTGSGYQAAILSLLCKEVHTIERQKTLYEHLQASVVMQSYTNISYYFGDGYLGLPQQQPFDKILLTAASSKIPPVLFEQLTINGIMVLPLGDVKSSQKMTKVIKYSPTDMDIQTFDDFSFVPMLSGTN